ncbi:hypothetical protein, partial [Janthinobacterium sp. LB2P10]|uniref:hypothetical protein n=1 Tax=Janthinobacterium sp. LB2P10 TaxID=3424194 RepID=UPI003F28CB61
KRCVCQLRRRKSMKRFGYFVNLLFSPCFTLHLHASFSEEANYSQAPRGPQALFKPFASSHDPLAKTV